MLNITAQANAEGAKSYFAKSDYYSSVDEQEIIGEWGGKGAVLLGVFGKVDKPSFDRLCDNLHPRTGEQLTKITREGRRVGYDFTWSAPKSVSVVHALTGDDSIMQAFRESVGDTMREIEADMQARVRRGGGESDRTTGNIVWAEFIHLTSRPVNGLPCPQLHGHVFCPNMTFDSVEGHWKAGQFGKIKQDAYYWQAVQQARFAHKLQELGYTTRRTKDAFEIDGVPDSVLKAFSLRTSLIEQVAEKLGITSAKSKAKLAATTREAKDDSVPYSELVTRWEGMLTTEEADALDIVAQQKTSGNVPVQNATHASFAVEHMFERSSVVDERRLLTLALRHGCGEVTPEGIREESDRLGLLKREEQGKVWVTTYKVLAEESRMIALAVNGKGTCKPLARREDIHFKEGRLNAGQREAITHVLTSQDRVMLLRGGAGTGKSTLTKEAVSQLEERGTSVVMLAPSAEASRGVLRREGFAEADTLTRFLLDKEMQAGAKDGLIWLDESSLVGSRTMLSLLETASQLNARVVLAGDTRQLGSVDRGAALRVLEDIAGLPVAEVTEIQRQESAAYKEAVKSLSRGDAVEGFDKLDAMGSVKLLPVWDTYEPIAKDYVARLKEAAPDERERAVLIVCPTHAEGQKITGAVRSRLKSEGLLSGNEREITRLVPLSWTQAERADEGHYTGEEVLQFHHNVGIFKAGQRVLAEKAVGKLPAGSAQHFSVFGASTIGICAGDTVRITANGKTRDGKHKLNNGAVYQVSGFTRSGDIAFSNGWVIAKDFGFLSHNYVNTTFAAQGRTVSHVLVAQTAESMPASSQEGFYVAASRGRRSVTIYTDDKHRLRDAIQHKKPRLSATELVNKPQPPFWQRVRRTVERIQGAAMLAAKQAAMEIQKSMNPRELVYER